MKKMPWKPCKFWTGSLLPWKIPVRQKTNSIKVLQQGLGYCWSVVVAAAPEQGKRLMEKWLACPDRAIRWIMQENLKKNRLVPHGCGLGGKMAGIITINLVNI